MKIKYVRYLLMLACVTFLGACAPKAQQEARQRFFWPPPPVEPKIEYVHYYFASDDVRRGVNDGLAEFILGKLQPTRLFTEPYAVASNGKGQIYVADFAGRRIGVVDLVKHEFRIMATTVGTPQKVTLDANDDIWVLDAGKKIIHHFGADETKLDEVQIPDTTRPTSLAVDRLRNRIYVTDTPAQVIRVFDFAGNQLSVIGRRGRGPGEFNFPSDIDLDPQGNLYVVDALNARIQIFNAEGKFVRAFGERGTLQGSFSLPKAVAVSATGLVYVTDSRLSKVVVFDREGTYLLTFGGREIFDGTRIVPGGFYFPTGIDVDANETIWIADLFNNTLYEYQYLTAAYLERRPIKPGEAFVPDLGIGAIPGSEINPEIDSTGAGPESEE